MKIIIILGLAFYALAAASATVAYTDAKTCTEATAVVSVPDATTVSFWVWIADCTKGTALATSTIKNVNSACAYYGFDGVYTAGSGTTDDTLFAYQTTLAITAGTETGTSAFTSPTNIVGSTCVLTGSLTLADTAAKTLTCKQAVVATKDTHYNVDVSGAAAIKDLTFTALACSTNSSAASLALNTIAVAATLF